MGLRKFMDNIKPTFSKGGKLGFLESTFDAFETFLFVPNTTTSKGAHIRDCNDMKRTMIVVVLALMPAFLFGCFNTGMQVYICIAPEGFGLGPNYALGIALIAVVLAAIWFNIWYFKTTKKLW